MLIVDYSESGKVHFKPLVYITSLFKGHPIMVMEYLALGDLLGLLRKSRGVHDKYHFGEGSIEELGIYDLVSFAKQIATGMVFLGSRGVRVHLLSLKIA